jgi:succinoglycan biosynthesis transport protein ExoP
MMPHDPNAMKNKTASPAGPVAPAAASTEQAAPAPPGLSAPLGANAIWHAIRRRWLTILVLGLGLGSLGAAAAWYIVPAKYTATATLRLEPGSPRGLNETNEDYANLRSYLAGWVKSEPVLDATLKKQEVGELSEISAQGKDRIAWMKSAALVDDKTGLQVLRLSLSGDRPDEMAKAVNEWAATCDALYTASEEAKIKERIKQVQKNYQDGTRQLRDKKNQLQARRDLLGLKDPLTLAKELDSTQDLLKGLQIQGTLLELDETKSESELSKLNERIKAPEKLTVSETAIDEAINKEMKDDVLTKAQLDSLVKAQAVIADLQSRLIPADRESFPEVVKLRAQIAGIQNLVAQEKELHRPVVEKQLRAKVLDDLVNEAAKTSGHIDGDKSQLVTLGKKIGDLETQVANLRAGGQAAGKSSGDVDGRQAEVAALEAEVKKSGEELASLEASLPVTPRLTVTEAAAPPMNPASDKRIKAAGGAFLGLFGLVFLGVAATEFRARRVYKAEDVSQGLGLPLMGTVPALSAKLRATAPVAGDESMGPMIESVDGIRTRLLYAGRSETLRVVMVASAVSGEGKTTLASHLAASLARGGRRTLLVDGDLRNPAAHKLFGMAAGPGFSELLRGEVEPGQVVQNTPLENLSLLAAGTCDRQALQALAQEGILRNVFDELKEHYDFLIVDVSPILPVADALLIGEHADAVLLSVLRNVSRLPAVHAARQRLASLGIRVLGAVVIGEGMEAYGQVRYPTKAAK